MCKRKITHKGFDYYLLESDKTLMTMASELSFELITITFLLQSNLQYQ